MKDEDLPDCCKKVEKPEGSGILQGIGYGLLAHSGCIAFLIVTVIGATAAITFLKPIMMNAYFFYILIAISFIFAGISSMIYLKKHGLLSVAGVKLKKKYLSTMFGVTIFINLLLFMVIFPALANVGPGITGAAVGPQASITLEVKIPCPGHAPLISNELKTLDISAVNFKFPNIFEVGYNPSSVSKQQILGLDVFDVYPATVIDESSSAVVTQSAPTRSSGGCGCGGGTCGGGSGSCCGG